MDFDRVKTKELVKAIIHQAQPRPWKIFLAYYLILVASFIVITSISLLLMLIAGFVSGYGHYASASRVFPSLLLLFLQLLLALFNTLMQMGVRSYCLKLWRKEPGSYRELLQGFRMPGKTLALFGLKALFSFLWLIPGLVIYSLLSGFVSSLTRDPIVISIFLLIDQIGFFAYFLTRILRYALAYYLLLDHPDWTARQALRESKTLMTGHRWAFLVLQLSFLGWFLLIILISYLTTAVAIVVGWTSLFQYENAFIFIGLILLTFLLSFLISSPLTLWLQAYWGTSTAGFYDWAIDPPPAPVSRWNDPHASAAWLSSKEPDQLD